MTFLYFNGDSFVAGVELADDILPEYPGLKYWNKKDQHSKHIEWINNTHNPEHYLYHHRTNNFDKLFNLEYERAFPNKVYKLTNLPVINHALGGSSMDRIVRTTLIDLYKLRQENPNDTIISFIGTTTIDRSSIPNNKIGLTDKLGFHTDYTCVAKSYSNTNDEYINGMREYKILYETSYHSLINFYENIVKLKYFCEKNNILLYFISAWDGPEQLSVTETEFLNRPLLDTYKSLANLEYKLNMKDYININVAEICPNGHFGEPIHNRVAIDIVKIIESHK